MKKNILFAILFPLLITACSSPDLNEPEVVIDIPMTKSFVGVVNKLNIPLNNLDADYFLLTDSKNRIYLNSLIHNLEDYIDYEVRLRGQLTSSELAGKPIDILNVEQVDIITSPEVQVDDLTYESSKFGIKFNYLANFDLEDFSSSITLSDSATRQLIKINFIDKLEMQYNSASDYISTLDLKVPKELFATNYHNFELYNISSDSIKYFLESNKYIVEITYLFLDDSNDNYVRFDDFLNSIQLSDLEIKDNIKPENTEELLTEPLNDGDEAKDLNFNDATEINSDLATDQLVKTGVDLEDFIQNNTNSEDQVFLKVISDFESKIANYLDNFQSSISYSFTDNEEFYLIYLDSKDNQKRVLVDYSSSYKIIATFVEGSLADWDLETGVNIAFDRPLTVLSKENNAFLPSISLQEGYRIFESLSMEIQAFYPTDWYFSRQDDVYIFSSDPKTFEPSMLITLMTDSASLPYESLQLNETKQVSNKIFVKKLKSGFFKLEFLDESIDVSYILDSLRDN